MSGDKLTVNFEGEEIVHTRAAYQDPGDAPGTPDKTGTLTKEE